jgi:hypothetical protein
MTREQQDRIDNWTITIGAVCVVLVLAWRVFG